MKTNEEIKKENKPIYTTGKLNKVNKSKKNNTKNICTTGMYSSFNFVCTNNFSI